MNIELNQGVDHLGRTFGYDHKRKNFITWDIADGKIVVAAVEHDELEDGHGSLAATRRDAARIAAQENRKADSPLLRAILSRFQRD